MSQVSFSLNFPIYGVALPYFFVGFYIGIMEWGGYQIQNSEFRQMHLVETNDAVPCQKMFTDSIQNIDQIQQTSLSYGIIQNNLKYCSVKDNDASATIAECLWQQGEMLFVPQMSDFTA